MRDIFLLRTADESITAATEALSVIQDGFAPTRSISQLRVIRQAASLIPADLIPPPATSATATAPISHTPATSLTGHDNNTGTQASPLIVIGDGIPA